MYWPSHPVLVHVRCWLRLILVALAVAFSGGSFGLFILLMGDLRLRCLSA